MSNKSDEIKKISIFSDLDEGELDIVLAHMKERTLEKDAVLFREGDPGREMFVILDGKVGVSVTTSDNNELKLAEMSGGSFIGEMTLIERLPRSATCKSIEKSKLLSLDSDGLLELMNRNGAIAEKILYRILSTMTTRLHDTSALLSDMVQWGEKARLRAITDEFTGLYNRRYLDDTLAVEILKAQSTRVPLSMVMVDLDHFSSVNKKYSEAFGDIVIYRASQAFKEGFRKNDVLARYGGDEFTFLLPGTSGAEALRLCTAVCAQVAAIDFPEQPGFKITASMGIAVYPDHADAKESLITRADKALYEAKESGRNRAVLAKKDVRPKKAFASIAERTRTFDRILALIEEKRTILLVGHELPDEDCISSLVAMSILISKFGKNVSVYIRDQVPAQLSFLMSICAYNKIPVLLGPTYEGPKPDAVFVLDTPKPDMIAGNQDITSFIADPEIPVVEFDHHLSADAALSGTEGLCLVTRATSTCELIALFCVKLANKPEVLARYGITELFSRNLVLSLLTGIIGDTRFGLTIKTNREQFFYKLFSNFLSAILMKSHRKNSKNYSSMTDISNSIQSLSVEERDIYQMLLDHARYAGRTGYVVLDPEESLNILARVDYTVFVKVIKSVTDFLSEQSGTIGMTVYYDMPEVSDLIQFRIRASRNITGIELRSILLDFDIADGGGHPGAVGFRLKKNDVADLHGYVKKLLDKIDQLEIVQGTENKGE